MQNRWTPLAIFPESHDPPPVARVLCDRRKCDTTFLSIDVCPHRRQCDRRLCGRDICPNDVKVDISATSFRSTLVRHLLKLTLVRHPVMSHKTRATKFVKVDVSATSGFCVFQISFRFSFFLSFSLSFFLCACVRACVRVCVCACVRACVSVLLKSVTCSKDTTI